MFSGIELVINMQNDLMNLKQKLKPQYKLTKYVVSFGVSSNKNNFI